MTALQIDAKTKDLRLFGAGEDAVWCWGRRWLWLVKGTMRGAAGGFLVGADLGRFGRGEGGDEAVPDDVHREFAGVHKVVCVKPIVSKLIQHYFVCGEVCCRRTYNAFKGEKEGALAELVFVGSVAEVADGGDSEDDLSIAA